jgi:desulfoferrodoxin (superoxide reductase-like protein)
MNIFSGIAADGIRKDRSWEIDARMLALERGEIKNRNSNRYRIGNLDSNGGEKMRKAMWSGVVVLAILLFQANGTLANRSEASIEGPSSAAKGSEVTLRVTATHNASTASHYTEWLKVMANKKEIARWDYSKENPPEGAVFTKEVKIKVTEDTEIVAEASCNNHGSKGPARHKIMVK